MSEHPSGGGSGGGGNAPAAAAAAAAATATSKAQHGLWGAPQPGAGGSSSRRRTGSVGSSRTSQSPTTGGGGSGSGGAGGGGGGLFNDGSLDRYLSSKPAAGAGGGKRMSSVTGGRTVRSSISASRSARVAKEYPGLAYSRRSSDDAPGPSASGAGSDGDRRRQSPGRLRALPSRGDRSAKAIADSAAGGDGGDAPIDEGVPTTIEASTQVMERQSRAAARSSSAAAKRAMRPTSDLLGDTNDDGPPLTIHIGGGGGDNLGNEGGQRGRRRSRGTRGAGATGASIASRDRSRGGAGRRSRSLSVARGAGERSYMAMSRTGEGGGGADGAGAGAGFAASRLLDRQHKRSSDGGGPPKAISVFRSSSSFGSFGKLNSLMMDGLDDSSSSDDDGNGDVGVGENRNIGGNNRRKEEGGEGGEEEIGPEGSQSAPNLFASKHYNDEYQKIRTQRRSSMDHTNDGNSGGRQARAGRSGGADSELWDSFRKSGRNRSSAAASGNPYLSFGGGRDATASGGDMPRRRHSDGKLSALVISEIDMSDDDSDADDGHAKVGGNARGGKGAGRPRTFSDGALDRAVKLGLLDEDDVEEVVNRVDQEKSYTLDTLRLSLLDEDDGDDVMENLKARIGSNTMPGKNKNVDIEVEGTSYEEQLRHYRAVIGEDVLLTDDDYGVGEEFEVDLRDNDGDDDEGGEMEGHPIRRVHSDGKLNLAASMLGEDHRPSRERSGRPGKDGTHRKYGEAENDRSTRDRKEHHGHRQRRHSDGALNIAAGMLDDITVSDDDMEAKGGTNRRDVMKVLGEPRKKRGQRPSKNYGSSNRSGSGLQNLKLNKLQALEQGAIRGIGSAVADRDRPPMTITIGGDRPSPSSRWGKDGCKVLANDDETLEAEGEVYASQHRRAARRRSLKDDIPQDEAIKKGPYEMYLLGVERMERRRSNDSGGKFGRRSSIGSEGRLGGRRGSLR